MVKRHRGVSDTQLQHVRVCEAGMRVDRCQEGASDTQHVRVCESGVRADVETTRGYSYSQLQYVRVCLEYTY